jgi:pimeloyl-ACP methyl ester carboxylesterase
MNPPQQPPLKPIAFGAEMRRLTGMLHAGEPTGGKVPAGVLVCKPFGREGIRSHRFLRVLAERLARTGHSVLRFDTYGTGDAMGDDADADLDGWADDVLVADRVLQEASGCTRTVWIGVRLGGEVALRAARRGPPSWLDRLVVFDLVIDGTRYLEHLRERHAAVLAAAYSVPLWPSPLARLAEPQSYRDEAMGFEVPPIMRRQLAAMTVSSFRWPQLPPSIVAVTDPGDADGKDLTAVLDGAGGRVRILRTTHSTDWTRESDGNNLLVPAAALRPLLEAVGSES